ncbi:hypothetical protein GCM10018962_77420 [Dactylosporangium matsuzakiense]|uniref:hypothetical protein n=1 Tax=Dactylosporangium matsuzakiense TaxID=53360 RepID=UPI0031F19C8D
MITAAPRELTLSALRIAAELLRFNPGNGVVDALNIAIECIDITAVDSLTFEQRRDAFSDAVIALRPHQEISDRSARLIAAADALAFAS